jgi:hypothetical protein
MEKTIKIGSKEYKMSSSAYTQFKYKNDTGRSLMQDLAEFETKYKDLLNIKEEDVNASMLGQVDEIIELVLRVAYIMANENDKTQAQTYEDFLKQIDDYYSDMTWLTEVVELATAPFQRRVQAN